MKLVNKLLLLVFVGALLGLGSCSSGNNANAEEGPVAPPGKEDNNKDNTAKTKIDGLETIDAADLEGFEIEYFYDQHYKFKMEGYEHRRSKSYPADHSGQGLEDNALGTFTNQCIYFEDQLGQLADADLTDFNCGEPVNIETTSVRRHFRSTARIQFDTSAMAAVQLGEVDAGYVDVDAFYGATYPWQDSRAFARQLHADACASLEIETYEEFGDALLLFDCGIRDENGGKNGWHYSSEAMALVRVDIDSIPRCTNGKLEQQTWYRLSGAKATETFPCQFGGTQTDYYEKFNEYVCLNSIQQKTGKFYKGDYLYTVNACQNAPLNCGIHSHGSKWWKKTGEIYERYFCPHGGRRFDVYEELTRAACYDGSVSYGQTRRGAYIRTEGRCRRRPMKPMPMPMPMPMKPMPMPMPMKPMPMPMPMKPMPMPMPMKPMPMPMPMKPMPMPMPMKPMPMPMPMKPMPMPMPMKPMPMPMPMKPMPMPMPMPMKPMPMPMPMKPMPMPMPMKPMPMPMPMKPMPMPMPMKPMPMPMPMKPMPMPMPMKPMPMPMPMKPMPMPMPMKPKQKQCPPGKIFNPDTNKCVKN